eukprot:20431-Heterococcus_DN1.PRE.1
MLIQRLAIAVSSTNAVTQRNTQQCQRTQHCSKLVRSSSEQLRLSFKQHSRAVHRTGKKALSMFSLLSLALIGLPSKVLFLRASMMLVASASLAHVTNHVSPTSLLTLLIGAMPSPLKISCTCVARHCTSSTLQTVVKH